MDPPLPAPPGEDPPPPLAAPAEETPPLGDCPPMAFAVPPLDVPLVELVVPAVVAGGAPALPDPPPPVGPLVVGSSACTEHDNANNPDTETQ